MDTCTIYRINEQGLIEIREFLSANHKLGGSFTRSMLEAWAQEAEAQLLAGNPAAIEIKSRDSIHGCAQDYTISNAGIDARAVEIE